MLRIPAEWEPHAGCWMAIPYVAAEWGDSLDAAQAELAEFARQVATVGDESVTMLVANDEVRARAQQLIGPCDNIRYATTDYGDCWTRDTGPTFGWDGETLIGALFEFNGWGGKFVIPGDEAVGAWIAGQAGAEPRAVGLKLEGGALDHNGQGLCIATRACVLNDNRGGVDSDFATQLLADDLGVQRVVWLQDGLADDHTDGHVDMIARFVSHDVVACALPPKSHPERTTLNAVRDALGGAGLRLLDLPAPDGVTGPAGQPLPANYANFYVANDAVFVPQYDCETDEAALDALRVAFPDRQVIGLSARALLSGGGALHCVVQPQPLSP